MSDEEKMNLSSEQLEQLAHRSAGEDRGDPAPEPLLIDAIKANPPEPPAPKPSVVEPLDRLQAENLQLKLEKVQLTLQVIQGNMQSALGDRNKIVLEMNDFRRVFEEKYGVDLAKVQIRGDGTLAPAVRG